VQADQVVPGAAVTPSPEAIASSTMGIPGVTGSITSTGGPNVSIVGGDEAVAISNRTSAMIDIAKVQGQVHAQSVQKVGELADKNPHEAVSIIRNWLHEDAA
jgi:flagellar M-ring protein FliF